ncbi:hypothetical protein FJR11_19390 [Anabaena sp. UHCC 0187]|uniref:hypothetical protein n=1 Tax=Anabaena sp. UHCC 0187 TaxID=2590018 RepID=UPI001448A03D|nr:hypothetical protein [Anabaena sp. UHCC 0187]MTJ14701.1 hypothetical protein [Anabaena sp. UHCC 0187]
MSTTLDIYALTLPKWAKPHTWSFPTLAKRAGIDEWRVEGSLFIWSKDSVDYVCRNMNDIHTVVTILENTWNEYKNPGWTLEQSVNEELLTLRGDKEEAEEKLDRINARIETLETWKASQC